MKFLITLKILCLMCVSLAILCAKQAEQETSIKNNVDLRTGLSEESLIQSAVSKLKKAKGTTTGHFHRISCELRLCGDQLLKEETSTYYTDYRKKKDCSIINYAEGLPDRTLEVIYKPYEKYLAVIDKRHNMKRQERRIELPEGVL